MNASVGAIGALEAQEQNATATLRAELEKVFDKTDPQATEASKLVRWWTNYTPTSDDFSMLRLTFLTLLPQVGGLVLMVARL